MNPGASGFDRWLSAYNFDDNAPILSREGIATPFKGESSQVAANAAIEFMREQSANDPQEATDVSKLESDRVQQMRAELEVWLASVTRSLNGKDYAAN